MRTFKQKGLRERVSVSDLFRVTCRTPTGRVTSKCSRRDPKLEGDVMISKALALSVLVFQAAVAPQSSVTDAWASGDAILFDPSAAASFALAEREARAARLDRKLSVGDVTIYPFAAISALGAWQDPKEFLSLYAYRTLDGTSVITIRRNDHVQSSTTWATSFNCARLDEVVTELEQVALPSIDVPLHGRFESDGIGPTVKDGVTYSLWLRQPAWSGGGSSDRLSVTYSSSGPFESWYEAMKTTAAPCWSSDPPTSR